MDIRQFLNTPVALGLGVRETKGNKFGIELELEGRNVGLADVATRGWGRVNDGSLRGESIEYTTTGPKDFEEATKLVTSLFKKFKENGVKFNDSIRTSTHVHLNFSDKTNKAVINFFTLFTLFEEVLQHYSGEDRKGNLFCVSTREAEGIIGEIVHALDQGTFGRFAGDRYKYAACNLSTLFKFGTIEVRTMRGANSAEQVNTWLSILNNMYEYALGMVGPTDLIRDLSILGAEGLMKKVFSPENVKELMSTFPAPGNLHYSLMEGARLIQVFAFVHEEDFTAEVEIKKINKDQRLPKTIQKGLFRGQWYRVWLPDGAPWHVNAGMEGFWADGEASQDNPRVIWRQELGRFVFRHLNGREEPLNWQLHHDIPDEGRPVREGARRNRRFVMPPVDAEDDDEGIEVDDWDEEEDDWDEEGDEI